MSCASSSPSALINGVAVPEPHDRPDQRWSRARRASPSTSRSTPTRPSPCPSPTRPSSRRPTKRTRAASWRPSTASSRCWCCPSTTLKKRMESPTPRSQAAYEADPERLQHARAPPRAADRLQGQGRRRSRQEGHRRAASRFADVAKEAGAKDSDIDLGLITKNQLDRPEDRRRRLRLPRIPSPMPSKAASPPCCCASPTSSRPSTHLRRRQGAGEGQARHRRRPRRRCRSCSTRSRTSARPASR